MGLHKLTLAGETVEQAIKQGLSRLGLSETDTHIQILQKDSYSIFGCQDAVVSIIYDQEESEKALLAQSADEFRAKFQISYKDGKARILIPPVFYEDRFVHSVDERMEYLKDFLDSTEVGEVPEETLQELATECDDPYEPTELKTMETIPLNKTGASMHLKVSEDNMNARAIIFADLALSEAQVFKALQQQGIVFGILKANIRRVLQTGYCGFFDIARGQPAEDDRPGLVEKFFQEDEHKQFAQMMEMLTIDTRSVKDINIAERHQILMRIGDVRIGRNGQTIHGMDVPRKELNAQDNGINIGENAYFSDNGKVVYAGQAGHIVWKKEDNFVDVEPVYIVDGNVDFAEGNIIGFVGKVIIKGDVKPKFSIIVEGDVEIQGSVEDATIKSTKGNIFVAQAVINRSEGSLTAHDTVHCGIAQNAKIRAKRVYIHKEAMNSHIEVEEEIHADGSPGAVVGGELTAKHLIRANIIGSERGVPTKVYVGDVFELKKTLRALHQKTSRERNQLKEAEQVVRILTRRKKNSGLTPSQEEQLEKTKELIPELKDTLQFAEEEEAIIKDEIQKRKNSRLEVLKTLYPQVDIHIFEASMIPETAEAYTGLRCSRGSVVRYSI